MIWRTHLAFGFLSGLLLMPFINMGNKYIFFGVVLIGALLPDIDSPNSKISSKIPIIPRLLNIFTKHRGILHTLLFAFIISGVVWLFVSYIYAAALLIGYISHLVIDGFTMAGINFLHPVVKLHLSGFIETGTFSEILLFILFLVLIIIILI